MTTESVEGWVLDQDYSDGKGPGKLMSLTITNDTQQETAAREEIQLQDSRRVVLMLRVHWRYLSRK